MINRNALAKDFRTIGVASIIGGLAGFILNATNIDISKSMLLISLGIVIWQYGLILTELERKEDVE